VILRNLHSVKCVTQKRIIALNQIGDRLQPKEVNLISTTTHTSRVQVRKDVLYNAIEKNTISRSCISSVADVREEICIMILTSLLLFIKDKHITSV